MWNFVDERRRSGWTAQAVLADFERHVASALGVSAPAGRIGGAQRAELGRLMKRLVPLVPCRYYSPQLWNRNGMDVDAEPLCGSLTGSGMHRSVCAGLSSELSQGRCRAGESADALGATPADQDTLLG